MRYYKPWKGALIILAAACIDIFFAGRTGWPTFAGFALVLPWAVHGPQKRTAKTRRK